MRAGGRAGRSRKARRICDIDAETEGHEGGRGSRKREQKCSSPKAGAGPGEQSPGGRVMGLWQGAGGKEHAGGGGLSFKWVLLWV